MKILILAGGTSNERAVSLRSGANVAVGLRCAGFDVVTADTVDLRFDLERSIKGIDVVFPVLHGAGGEDGTLQAQLEGLKIPFVGSDMIASSLAFDKHRAKAHFQKLKLQTPEWQIVDGGQFQVSELRMKPHVIKPIHGGSSIDTHIIHDISAGLPQGNDLFDRYCSMLLEELIIGHEITVAVLDGVALPIILIVPPEGKQFDYENKYNGRTREIVAPDMVPPKLARKAQELAINVHTGLGLRHLSRTDMIINRDGDIYVLEVNTMPGMTERSLFPKAALAAGLDMAELTRRLVNMALE